MTDQLRTIVMREALACLPINNRIIIQQQVRWACGPPTDLSQAAIAKIAGIIE